MKPFSKVGLLLAVALVACTAFAVSAQAQVTINPDDTNITGTASEPTLDYEGTTVVCDTGTAVGTTGIAVTDDVPPVPAPDVVNVEVDFFDNCNISGLGAEVDCSAGSGDDFGTGTARLRALTSDTNLGEVDRLNTGFECVVSVLGVCTVTVGAQELPVTGGDNRADLLGEGGSEQIDAEVDVAATRTGSALCGPASGIGGFTALYNLEDDNPNADITFD